MRKFLLIVCLIALQACTSVEPESPEGKPQDPFWDVQVSQLGTKVRLIGKLGVPLGEVVTVQGVVIEGPFKGYEGGPTIRVQRINGKPTEEDIRVPLRPYSGEFGDSKKFGKDIMGGVDLPKLEMGKTYEFEGFQEGGFVGVPSEAYTRADLMFQTADFYFRQELTVYRGKVINPIIFSPADFVNREALLEGKAVNRGKKAYIESNGWKLLTNATGEWPKDIEGKTVEGLGTVKLADAGGYRLDHGVTRLVKLEDQVGKSVELRGTAWSLNGHWWFEYRGRQLYVEEMDKLPGWNTYLHGSPVVITGVLEEENLPDVAEFMREANATKKKCFIVRKARWKPLDALLASERTDRW